MAAQLDHLILLVNDRAQSIDFYTQVLGFAYEGEREPFSVVRVNPGLTLQIAAWGTSGGTHLAFAMARAEFDDVFARIRHAGIPYGDSFQSVGNMRGPGDEAGRSVHVGLAAVGVWSIATGAVLGALDLAPRHVSMLAWSIVVSNYAVAASILVRALATPLGLDVTALPLRPLIQGSLDVSAAASFVAAVLILRGGAAAVRAAKVAAG